MNIKNAEKLIDFLKSIEDLPKEDIRTHFMKTYAKPGPHYFNMENYLMYLDDVNFCGTAGCIAGSACYLYDKDLSTKGPPFTNIIVRAEDYLGLSASISTMLFAPDRIHDGFKWRNIGEIRKKHAIYVLEKMVERVKADKVMFSDHVLRYWNDSFMELGS